MKYFLSLLFFTSVGAQLLLTAKGYAEGMDSLQPETSDKKEGDEGQADQPPPAGTAEENQEKPSGDTKAAEAVTPPVMTKSPLDDKAFFETSFSWIGTSAAKGDFRSSGGSDFTAGYLLPWQVLKGVKTYGMVRYLPVFVTANHESSHYKGVINVYGFGGKADYSWKNHWNFFGEAYLGMSQANLTTLSDTGSSSDLGKSGVALGLGGGANWSVNEKFGVGPKFDFTLGQYRMTQFGANFSFLW